MVNFGYGLVDSYMVMGMRRKYVCVCVCLLKKGGKGGFPV